MAACSLLEPSFLRFILLKNSDNKRLRSSCTLEAPRLEKNSEVDPQFFEHDDCVFNINVSLVNCRIGSYPVSVPTFQIPMNHFPISPNRSIQPRRSFHGPSKASKVNDWNTFFRPGQSNRSRKEELQKFIRDAAMAEKSNSRNAFSYGVLARSSLNPEALIQSPGKKLFRWVKLANNGFRVTGRIILCCVLSYVAFKSAKLLTMTQAEKDELLGSGSVNPG